LKEVLEFVLALKAKHPVESETEAVTDTFLRVNGCTLNLTDDRAYNLVMRVARGTMTKNN
jgi:hypothetical protein